MKILVTGGAGFIGAHLCTALVQKGHEVFCLDSFYTSDRKNVAHLDGNDRFRMVVADVEDEQNLDLLATTVFPGVEQIYHLACPASPIHYQRNPVKTMRTAFLGTMNVFNVACHQEARVLITSTSEIYGDPEVHPQRESYFGNVNTLGPRSCYDEGKRAAEALAYSYATSRALDVKIARLFNTYGPGMGFEDGRLIPNFMGRALRGETLEVNGDGSQTRSLCYVDDMIEALQLLMASHRTVDPVEAVNLGNPDERSVLDIATDIACLFNPMPGIVHNPALQDDPRQRNPDISRAKALLGWEPKVTYAEGILRTVDWFKHTVRERT